ncbi:helix-turn-helix transcriptional regulator [Flavilitoribacter nigricans]|uniref:DNA-binding transcriptional regulator n=1 Tax=Flavilitoribacter nigricans (strain ATCC 23147 / DSM 23189 / NBRC 102662 / NCIMB 1420 / SS-2) TaxID=1122177 RepID=A0A2D0N877_FLAN2|nr:YafY family protein [Flavilitoribacter nigricans]PHN04712.1 DNA-binding transcriptional regulator [Flavilitoribacter nigricans DSM 23189 = NBRC 102662]
MNRTDRLMGIINLIQSKKYISADRIAEHYTISVRTVYRDLKAINEIGVPISFEKDKGYFILDSYFLPPVSLSMEEANALALMEPIVQRFADRSIQQHFDTALNKIKMVLSTTQREQLEEIQQHTAHYLPEVFTQYIPNTYYLTTIQKAIIERTVLKIDYENNQGEKSSREVEPIGLTFYSLNWHLIGWCHLRQDYRDFRTSRILQLKSTIIPFRKSDHLSLHEYLRDLEEVFMKEQWPKESSTYGAKTCE